MLDMSDDENVMPLTCLLIRSVAFFSILKRQARALSTLGENGLGQLMYGAKVLF